MQLRLDLDTVKWEISSLKSLVLLSPSKGLSTLVTFAAFNDLVTLISDARVYTIAGLTRRHLIAHVSLLFLSLIL